MAKLKDDHIKWILELDAKGVQSEITTLSSLSKELEADNKRLQAEYAAAAKQMKETRKELERLTKAGKEDSDEFKELEATLESVSSDMTDYKRKMVENTKAIEQNRKTVEEMVKTLRIEDMTMDQLKKRAKELQTQLDKTAEATHPEQYNALDKELKAVKSRMSELDSGSKSMFSVFKGGLMVLTGNLMTKAIDKVGELISTGLEWVKVGMDMAKSSEGTIAFFKELSDSKRILKEVKEATDGTISSLDIMKKTIRAKEMGIPIEDMANLMKYARIQAQKLGKDMDYMSNSIVDGIGRKSTLVLDNLGISATKVQAEVKKSGDFTQGVLKIVNEELEKQGTIALTGADKAAIAAAKWEDAQLKIGQKAKWLSELWDKVSGNIADKISGLIGDTRSLSEQYKDQVEKVADLEANSVTLAKRYDELKSKSTLTKDESAELNRIMNTLSQTIPGVVTEWDKYGNILSINTQKVYDFIDAEKAKLKYMHRDTIKQAGEDIEDYTEKLEKVKAKYNKGFWEETITNRSTGGDSYTIKHIYTPEQMAQFEKEILEYGQMVKGAEETVNELTGKSIEDQINQQKNLIAARSKFTAMNKKELDAWIKDEKNAANEYMQIAKQIYDQRFGTNPDKETKKSKGDPELQRQKKALNSMLETLETSHQTKMADIRKKYLDGGIKSESDFNRKKFSQEQAYYILQEESLKRHLDKVTKTEVREDILNKIAAIQNKRLEQQINYQAKLEQIILNANPEEKERQEYASRLRDLGIFGKSRQELQMLQMSAETEEEKNLLQKKIDALEILEKQHQDNLFNIRQQAKNKEKAQSEEEFENSFKARKDEMQMELNDLMAQAQTLRGGESFDAEMAVHMQRLQMINEEIQARKNAGLETSKQIAQVGRVEAQMTATIKKENDKRVSVYNQYANTLGTAFGNFFAGQTSALEAFGGAVVDILFDTLGKIVETKIMEATAVAIAEQAKAAAIAAASPDSVMSFGATSAIRIAAIGAIITGALVAAKTALKGMISKKKGSSSSSSSSETTTTSRRVVSGYADGGYHEGYTGPGDKYDVKGYFPDGEPYHAGEYIIPQEKLRIPRVVRMVREIESIPSSGGNKNPLPEGFADGGYHGDTSGKSHQSPNFSELNLSIKELNALIAYWKANGGIPAIINIYDLAKSQELVDDFENFGKKV